MLQHRKKKTRRCSEATVIRWPTCSGFAHHSDGVVPDDHASMIRCMPRRRPAVKSLADKRRTSADPLVNRDRYLPECSEDEHRSGPGEQTRSGADQRDDKRS